MNIGGIRNSVEKLSIAADPNLQVSKQWEMIPEANLRALPALYRLMSIPLNENEIVILGGSVNHELNV